MIESFEVATVSRSELARLEAIAAAAEALVEHWDAMEIGSAWVARHSELFMALSDALAAAAGVRAEQEETDG